MAGTVCEDSSSIESTPRQARPSGFARRMVGLVTGLVVVTVGIVSAQGASAAPAPSRTSPSTLPASCKATYTVRAGDGWTIIARRLEVGVGDLYTLNGASSRTPLFAGRPICVPVNAKGAVLVPTTVPNSPGSTNCAKAYTVRAGDGWTIIARQHSVSVDSLYTANRSNARTPLFAGRTICLPANAATPTTAAPPPPTTAPAPPTTARPPATVPPARQNWTQAEVVAIIRQVWPDHLEEKAITIAWRESNHRPGVRNFCCFGLFQIYFNVHRSWLASMGVTSAEQLYNPLVNAQAALALYNRAGGWGPWRMTAD